MPDASASERPAQPLHRNRLPLSGLVVAAWVTQALTAHCTESLYSFSGRISTLVYDGGGILAVQNVAIGDAVSASFLVDFESPGYYLLNDGTQEFPADPPLGNVHTTYFYSRLFAGTLLPELNGGRNNGPKDMAEYFTGWNQNSPLGNEGLLRGGTGDSYFTVDKSGLTSESQVQEWEVGTKVRGILVSYSDQDWSIAWADMTLDSISVVPEPGAAALLAVGGFIWLVRRRRQMPE